MTIFRSKKNGLLYTITFNYYYPRGHKVHPYKHNTEIGLIQKKRFRQFRSNQSLKDFIPVAHC